MPPSKCKFLAEKIVNRLLKIGVLVGDNKEESVKWLATELQKITETEAFEEA